MGRKYLELKDKNAKWLETLGIPTTRALSRLVADDRWEELVMLSELMQERNIARIADDINSFGHGKRMLLICGPSSAGKTTFAKRLSMQLKLLGLSPVVMSLDNYYLDRDQAPLDKDSRPDFENVMALDLPLLNDHLLALVNEETVSSPCFDFKNGRRKEEPCVLSLGETNILLIEGIHALNDKLSASVDDRFKYKIYLSPVSTMHLADTSRELDTRDIRLVRRIVRDSQFRNSCADCTIGMWASVRRGEELYIHPFMETADVMFNTHLAYELCVLRSPAQSKLELIQPSLASWPAARRLIEIMEEFPPMSANAVPGNSILREFLGGSLFDY